MPIADPVLVKPTNLLCPHCAAGSGCTVYERRPVTCAEWVCGWIVMRQVPADWRPSESGVVFRVEDLLDDEITVTVLDPEPKLRSSELAELLQAWHEAGIVLHLEAVGTPGFYPCRRPINALVEDAGGDAASLGDALAAELDAMMGEHIWVPDGFALRSDIPAR